MRLSRLRGPSAQAASSPFSARSTRAPKRTRSCSSRRWRSAELSSLNQKRMRRFSPSADRGSLPNQKSRTLRASSMGPGSFRAGLIRLEQPLELLRGGNRGGAEFLLVLLDLVLCLEGVLIVLAESAHCFAGGGRGFSELFEHRGSHLEARRVGLTDYLGDTGIHECERLLAVAC